MSRSIGEHLGELTLGSPGQSAFSIDPLNELMTAFMYSLHYIPERRTLVQYLLIFMSFLGRLLLDISCEFS